MTAQKARGAADGMVPVALRVLGTPVTVCFAPGLADLAAEVRDLWRHLADGMGGRAQAPAPGAPAQSPASADDTEPDGHAPLRAEGDGRAPLRVDMLPRGVEPSPEADDSALVECSDPARTYTVSGAVTRALIRARIGEALLLHAGSVVAPGLGTVTVVGGSGAGKSTAVTVLAQGGGYLTDELTVVDPGSLQVVGYPKPVSRRDPRIGIKRDHDLAADGLHPLEEAAPPAHLVLLERRGDNGAPESARALGPASLRRVPLAEALGRLAGQSSSLWTVPDPLGTLARLIDGAGGVLEARYTDADELADLLAHPPAPVRQEWAVIDPPGTSSRAATAHVDGTAPRGEPRFDARPFVQALQTQGATVVLREGSVVTLGGLGACIWRVVAEHGPLTAEEIEQAAIAELGAHPQSAEVVDSALAELTRPGSDVLVRCVNQDPAAGT